MAYFPGVICWTGGVSETEEQILGYVHDPDSVTYAAENITDVVGSIIKDNHIVKKDRQ